MSTTEQSEARDGVTARGAFRFGRNWQRYVSNYLDPDRERIAADSLRRLIGDLRDRTFLDIGCGSGLFSLCAHRAGARRVVSFDVDPDSVAATRLLHERAGSPENWLILRGSILDPRLIQTLERADVVYSWGVLHHTGDMYSAILNAASLVTPGGLFAIAIYNRVSEGWLNSERWWWIKRTYNRVPSPGKRLMEVTYAGYWTLRLSRNGNPLRIAREYRRSRGMALWTDLIDWLGGFPYEFAAAQEIVDFCEQQLNMCCREVIEVGVGESGNNQFVFERPLSRESD